MLNVGVVMSGTLKPSKNRLRCDKQFSARFKDFFALILKSLR